MALTCHFVQAQQQQSREIQLGDNTYYLSSIELAPDGKTLAIGTAKGNLIFWNIESQQVERKFVFEGFGDGAYMNYSPDGRYLLLLEQYFTDWRLNKDRPSRAAVVDVASGTIVFTKEGVHAAAFTPDSHSLVTLQGDAITFWNITSGASEKTFRPPNISNSFCVTSDGTSIVVAQRPTEADLKSIPSIRNDKTAIKEALKYREIAVFYDTKDFKRQFMVNDILDIVFSMHMSPDGKNLYLFNAPNTKFRSTGGSARNAYIQVANIANGEVSRTMFSTNAAEPIYKESPNGLYFAVTSVEHQQTVANSLLIFDRESGENLKRFKNDIRLLENKVFGRACFAFLPDQKTIALGYGNRLVLWSFEE